MRRVVLRDITAIGLCLAVVTHNIKYSCYVPKTSDSSTALWKPLHFAHIHVHLGFSHGFQNVLVCV